jgi:putative salt-induced outer membrane protein YdiY
MFRSNAGLILIWLLGLQQPLAAQDQDAFTWENEAELAYAQTSGNASTNTLAASAKLSGEGGQNAFQIELGGIRASTTTRRAVGTTGSFQEDTETDVSAASYYAKARYDRTLDGIFVFAGGGWERNTFAGFENRYSAVAGFGRTWVDVESGHFKTDIGGTYTVQKDVEPAPGADDAFGGLRLSIDAARSLTSTTDFTSTLVADQNLEETDDLRADWTNAVAVSISEGLALKVSYQLLYDHQPALVSLDLFDGAGTPTGTQVSVVGDKLDTVLAVALVIKL